MLRGEPRRRPANDDDGGAPIILCQVGQAAALLGGSFLQVMRVGLEETGLPNRSCRRWVVSTGQLNDDGGGKLRRLKLVLVAHVFSDRHQLSTAGVK